MEKVLVTGSGGYIGRHVVKHLLDMGYSVTAADICNDGVDERAEIINRSVFEDCPDIYHELGEPDVCIHLAWRNGFVHNASSHMEDLSGHCRFLRQMVEGGLKIWLLWEPCMRLVIGRAPSMSVPPAILSLSTEWQKMPFGNL